MKLFKYYAILFVFLIFNSHLVNIINSRRYKLKRAHKNSRTRFRPPVNKRNVDIKQPIRSQTNNLDQKSNSILGNDSKQPIRSRTNNFDQKSNLTPKPAANQGRGQSQQPGKKIF